MRKFSIVTRLALLILLPMTVICALVFDVVKQSQVERQRLTLTIERLRVQHGMSELGYQIAKVARNQTMANSIEGGFSAPQQQFFWRSLDKLPELNGYQRDLKEVIEELQSVDRSILMDNTTWFYSILQEMTDTLERHPLMLSSPEAEVAARIVEQLSLLSFWTQKEAWLIYRFRQTPNSFDVMALAQAIQNQQRSLNRFLDMGASHQQVETLLQFFSSPRYQGSLFLRDEIVLGDPALTTLQAYQIELDFRQQTLQQRIDAFSQEAETTLIDQVTQLEQESYWVSTTALAMLVLLCWLGFTTWRRVSYKLTDILGALSELTQHESEHRSREVVVDGNDEFTQFAQQVNQIIAEKTQQTQEIMAAKDAAVAANRAKSSFLANMSHEIRTPLNAIIGMTEILSQSALTAKQREVLSDIDTSSHSLLVLLNDILDLSKIESGNLAILPQENDVRETVYQSLILFQSQANRQGLDLHLDFSPELPAKIAIDENRVKQILTNLIGNAIKFTDKGYVAVWVGYQPLNDETGTVFFQVRDSGIGIDESKLSAIFAPFIQEDDSITRQFGGTGLGLAISRHLAVLMGGELSASSTKGVGSCFEFQLPVTVCSWTHWQSLLIRQALLITELPAVQKRLLQECQQSGIDVTTIESVEQCQELERSVDVVLYCASPVKDLSTDLHQLESFCSLDRVIVCQPHNVQSAEQGELPQRILTLPFLGRRFRHCLEAIAVAHLQDASSSIAPPPNRIARSHNRIAAPVSLMSPFDGGFKRILIAEDNLMNQKIASFFLEKAGYDYWIASNGQEALEAITQGASFDAILMDCMMPVMDGITATKEIRHWEQQQGKGKTPIIALTASVLEEDVQSCFDAGMDAYLPKPYKSAQLFELFEELDLA